MSKPVEQFMEEQNVVPHSELWYLVIKFICEMRLKRIYQAQGRQRNNDRS